MEEKKIYMGCGEDKIDGFIHCDIRKLDHVDIICTAWELSKYMTNIDHIYSRHMLEHLTNFEADRTLRDWLKSLKVNGTIKIIVPDIDFHARQWLESEWNEDTIKDKWSNAKHSFAGFWGWQEECDPWAENYNNLYWSVHKSGYNKKRMEFLLKRIGYLDISIEVKNKWHLVVTASKPLGGGERQDSVNLEDIRLDHRKRYDFANKLITKSNAIVIDSACGVGYGSYILSKNENVKEINSIDISTEAIQHGKKYYANNKTKYFLLNLDNEELPPVHSDYFISFETIEHLKEPEKYIQKISNSIYEDTLFIGSVPNEDIMPYTKYFAYHTRHFTVTDLKQILNECGFTRIEFYQQKRDEPSTISNISDGQYIIFVAKKSK